jgi:hypothetical protein
MKRGDHKPPQQPSSNQQVGKKRGAGEQRCLTERALEEDELSLCQSPSKRPRIQHDGSEVEGPSDQIQSSSREQAQRPTDANSTVLSLEIPDHVQETEGLMAYIESHLDPQPEKQEQQLKDALGQVERKYISVRRKNQYADVNVPASLFALEVQALSANREHRGRLN